MRREVLSEKKGSPFHSGYTWEGRVHIQDVKYHVVPEERRSKVFALNHKIEGIQIKDGYFALDKEKIIE